MIIISSRIDDVSTSNVIDWLCYQKKDYVRFNGDANDAVFSYRNGYLYLKSKYRMQEELISNIQSFWYRKCGLNYSETTKKYTYNQSFSGKPKEIMDYVLKHAKEYSLSEFKAYREFIFAQIDRESKKSIGNYRLRELNKVDTLNIAKELGLSIPKTFILDSKVDLTQALHVCNSLIVKPLYEGVYDIGERFAYVSYTSSISESEMENIPDHFPPALFQEQIEKKFEIRVIYINKVCYSVAMFTQDYEPSRIDGRKCPQEILRMTPYKLPMEIEKRVILLMQKIGLTYGALDFIVSKNNRHIFLEINPVGQYSAYGISCNYYLDKIISEQL